MSEEARVALERFILGLADGKRLLGVRYSDWLLGAPSIESGIAMSSMCQDEWGHARLLYAMLKELGLDPMRVEHERPADRGIRQPGLARRTLLRLGGRGCRDAADGRRAHRGPRGFR